MAARVFILQLSNEDYRGMNVSFDQHVCNLINMQISTCLTTQFLFFFTNIQLGNKNLTFANWFMEIKLLLFLLPVLSLGPFLSMKSERNMY